MKWTIGPYESGGKNWWISGQDIGRNEHISIGCSNIKPTHDWDIPSIPNTTSYSDCISPPSWLDRLRGVSHQIKRNKAIKKAKRWIERNSFKGE